MNASATASQDLQRATEERFGFLWSTVDRHPGTVPAYHYRWLRGALPAGHLRGTALDAGCGPGIDAVHMAEDGAARVFALDSSDGGMKQTRTRARECSAVYPVQGCLESLPFPSQTFEFVYSYGVLHHLVRPEVGFVELARVLKPGGWLAIYVYEDFGDRSRAERALLALVTRIRRWTVRWPPRVLYRACQLASPVVFVGFTVPSRLLAAVPWTRPLARRVPFRHGRSFQGLVGDLFDRFAAPVEHRYRRWQIAAWFAEAGLVDVQVLPHRGWLAFGRKHG